MSVIGEPSITPLWRKSTFSASGDCVEVARVGGTIVVRDSKHPDGPSLTYTRSEWTAFLAGVRAGQFDIETLFDTGH